MQTVYAYIYQVVYACTCVCAQVCVCTRGGQSLKLDVFLINHSLPYMLSEDLSAEPGVF